MSRFNPRPANKDEGICQYAHCGADVPDEITVQLCNKHLERAFAAYVLLYGNPLAPSD